MPPHYSKTTFLSRENPKLSTVVCSGRLQRDLMFFPKTFNSNVTMLIQSTVLFKGLTCSNSVKSLFVKTGAWHEIWADMWRTRWQHQVTVTASVPLWIVSAGSDIISEDLQTTLPLAFNLPVTTTGQFERKRERREGEGALWWHIMSNTSWADIWWQECRNQRLTSRGVTWFLVECQVMSWALLKDESRVENNSPGVNNTTTQHDITPENAKK